MPHHIGGSGYDPHELSVVGVFLALLFPVWFAISLFYNLKAYRYASAHPEVSSKYSLSRLKARCTVLSILLLIYLGLGLWRLLPCTLSGQLDQETPTTVTAAYSEPRMVNGVLTDYALDIGPLEVDEATPLLEVLDQIVLRRDFHNLIPKDLPLDTRLNGGRQARLTLEYPNGTRTLTFYGTHQLTITGNGPMKRYRFYEPEYVEELFTRLHTWNSRSLSEEELTQARSYFGLLTLAREPNPVCHFFTSYYQDVRQLDLAAFVQNQSSSPVSQEALEELRSLGQEPQPGQGWVQISDRSVSSLLQRFAGIWLEDLDSSPGTAIWSEANSCFYALPQDAALRGFPVVSGTVNQTTAVLYGETEVLTLERQGPHWYIRSFLPQ